MTQGNISNANIEADPDWVRIQIGVMNSGHFKDGDLLVECVDFEVSVEDIGGDGAFVPRVGRFLESPFSTSHDTLLGHQARAQYQLRALRPAWRLARM